MQGIRLEHAENTKVRRGERMHARAHLHILRILEQPHIGDAASAHACQQLELRDLSAQLPILLEAGSKAIFELNGRRALSESGGAAAPIESERLSAELSAQLSAKAIGRGSAAVSAEAIGRGSAAVSAEAIGRGSAAVSAEAIGRGGAAAPVGVEEPLGVLERAAAPLLPYRRHEGIGIVQQPLELITLLRLRLELVAKVALALADALELRLQLGEGVSVARREGAREGAWRRGALR
jgi:hypothetical protein